MDKLFDIFGGVSQTKLGGGDSFTDQLSCKYTVYILSLVVILSTTRVFIDEPISCYCPTHFTDNQVEYTKKVASLFLKSLYHFVLILIDIDTILKFYLIM